MHAQHPVSSGRKAITAPPHLLATAIVGEALITYQVQRTPAARARLESQASMARRLGYLTDRDTAVVEQLLQEECP